MATTLSRPGIFLFQPVSPPTITLKALFQAHSNDTTLDRELFERTVKQVILQPDASVQLRLLNDIVV